MTPLEIFAVVLSLASVVLTVRRNIWCWLTGMLGVAAYFVVFVETRLYADAALQVVFLAQNAYGWWFWVHHGANEAERPIGELAWPARLAAVAVTAIAALLVGTGLARWTDAAFPYVDAALSATSLMANWLLARKLIENWWLWIAADVGYVAVFWLKGLHLSAGLYAVFLGLCVAGIVEWRRTRRAQLAVPA